MSFPGFPLPTDRTNATPTANVHPADHNAANQAANDLQAQINDALALIAAASADAASRVLRAGDAMTGALGLPAGTPTSTQAVRKDHMDTLLALRLALTGGTMTGMITLPVTAPTANQATRRQYVDDEIAAAVDGRVAVGGDTMTGILTINPSSGQVCLILKGNTAELRFVSELDEVFGQIIVDGTEMVLQPESGSKLRLVTAGVGSETVVEGNQLSVVHASAPRLVLGSLLGDVWADIVATGALVTFDAGGSPFSIMGASNTMIGKASSSLAASGHEIFGEASSVIGSHRSSIAAAGNMNFYARHNGASHATGEFFLLCANSSGTTIGGVTQNGASNVSFPTSSDERLKRVLRDLSDDEVREILRAIQPVVYEMLDTPGVERVGFLAQELYRIWPTFADVGIVHIGKGEPGDPDVLDDDGNVVELGFIPWMVDHTLFVPLLVAGWQALDRADLDKERRIAALERRAA